MSKSKEQKLPRVTEESEVSLGRVGIIALFGFVIGVVWPRLAGVSLVPEAPVESEALTEVAEAESEAPAETEPEVIELTPEDRLAISPPKITSCVTAEGKKSTSCDDLDVDSVVHAALISLLGCPAATGVFGNLSLGFRLNFDKGKLHSAESGKSTDLPASTTKELLLCAEKELGLIQLKPLPHQFSEYQVFYQLEFKTPEAAAEERTSVTPASGQATVRWQVAQIRKDADTESEVLARVLSGARVIVTGRLGKWYRVKFDAKGREGWVHGAALGLK